MAVAYNCLTLEKRFHMDTILVPVDFSPTSNNATRFAALLAKSLNAKILLFHAYMLPTPVIDMPYVMTNIDEVQKENEAAIKKEAEQLHLETGVETEWLVRIGIPSDEAKSLTEDRAITAIVMGMSGAGEIDKIIGSTTLNVVRKVRVPVLVVPQDAVFTSISHITYASDFSYTSNAAMFRFLKAICQQFRSKLHVVHVTKEQGVLRSNQKAFAGLQENLPGVAQDFETVADESVTHGISTYLETNHSDLLVMVAHKHGFFDRLFSRSRTASMAYETKIPLLVLQDKS